MLPGARSSAQTYGLAILLSITTVLITAASFLQTGAPFLLPLIAVLVSTWYGGRGPGLIASLVTGVGVLYLVIPPSNSLAFESQEDAVRMALYMACAVLVTVIAAERDRARGEIARRVKAEDSLRESEERFRTMADSSAVIIWVTHPAGDLQFVNRIYQEFFGVTYEQVTGEKWQPLVHPEDAPGYVDAFFTALGERAPFDAEARVRRADGEWRWISSHGLPRYSPKGEFLGYGGMTIDINERKKVEQERERLLEENRERADELLAANRELETFAYSVSHDLRTPLAYISNFAQLLLEDCGEQLDQSGRRYLQLIEDNAASMESLIQGLLALSRATRRPLSCQVVSMEKMVRQVLEDLRDDCAGREVEIIIGPPESKPGTALPDCQADPVLIKQVWTNLLSNALKFTRKRERARIEIGGADSTYFVRDNGAGFDSNHADQLFEMFRRLHSEDEFPGTGIGLATVQRIIRRHGGRIWAESQPDHGATFYFTIPPLSGLTES